MKKSLVILITFLGLYSCTHDPYIPDELKEPVQTEDCDEDMVYFVNEVQPLINSTCATSGCHDAATAQDGVILDTYSNIIQTGDVKPFRPEDSELYEVLFEDGDDLMPPPPQSPLTDAQKQMIYDWIMQGAQNNECIDGCNTNDVSFAADIEPVISSNCLSCHSGPNPNGGISLATHSEITSIAQTGLLMNVLTASGGASLMPPAGALDNCSIDKIEKWINDGSPNN